MNRNKLTPWLGNRRGFTLIELLVVILILGILAALIVPRLVGRSDQAKVGAAKSDISELKNELNTFRLDNGRYPTSDEGLNALLSPPSDLGNTWKGPYTDNKDITNDPWGNPFIYKSPGDGGPNTFTIESYGSDGVEGGTGDAADIIEQGG